MPKKWDSSVQKYLNRGGGDQTWCLGSLMNVKLRAWHEGTERNTSGSQELEQVPWHWLIVWWSQTRTFLTIIFYLFVPTFSAAIVLWPLLVRRSRLKQKSWKISPVLTCLGWKPLRSDQASSTDSLRSVDLPCGSGWERADVSSEERWLLAEYACSQPVMVPAWGGWVGRHTHRFSPDSSVS